MALTQAQLDTIRAYLPDDTNPTDAALDDAYYLIGTVYGTVLRFYRRALASLVLGGPAQFAVSGEYSQNVGDNIKALTASVAALEVLEAEEVAQADDAAGIDGSGHLHRVGVWDR